MRCRYCKDAKLDFYYNVANPLHERVNRTFFVKLIQRHQFNEPMTLLSFALRIKEVRDLQNSYAATRDIDVLARLKDMEKELDRLIHSIITTPRNSF